MAIRLTSLSAFLAATASWRLVRADWSLLERELCLVADFDVVGEADLDLVAVDLRREAVADLAGETGAFLALFLLVGLTGFFVLSLPVSLSLAASPTRFFPSLAATLSSVWAVGCLGLLSMEKSAAIPSTLTGGCSVVGVSVRISRGLKKILTVVPKPTCEDTSI